MQLYLLPFYSWSTPRSIFLQSAFEELLLQHLFCCLYQVDVSRLQLSHSILDSISASSLLVSLLLMLWASSCCVQRIRHGHSTLPAKFRHSCCTLRLPLPYPLESIFYHSSLGPSNDYGCWNLLHFHGGSLQYCFHLIDWLQFGHLRATWYYK